MINQIRSWYLRNHTEITWFLVGFLVMAGLQDLRIGNYVGALVSFGLAYINYKLN